jgi:hypothetical protein
MKRGCLCVGFLDIVGFKDNASSVETTFLETPHQSKLPITVAGREKKGKGNPKICTSGRVLISHDGLDPTAAQSLSGEARENATRKLLFSVNIWDSYAASVLAAMGDTSYIVEIRTILSTSDADNGAISLRNPRPFTRRLRLDGGELIEVLGSLGSHFATQMTAAIGLRDYKDVMSEQVLLMRVEHDK